VYTSIDSSGDFPSIGIRILNLATGELSTVFTTSEYAWIFYVSISPDATQLVMSYIPPSQGGVTAIRAIYVMPLDGTSPPTLLFTPPTEDDYYVHAEWSPDGAYIYYAHYNQNEWPQGQLDPAYDLFRLRYPDGQPERIAAPAFWPRLSSDTSKLAYISIDPESGQNDLFVANADGSSPQRVIFSGTRIPEIIDAPIFSADSQSILFSAPPPVQAYAPDWFEKLLGIRAARAHNVPSDWWSVPVTGGEPVRLTRLQTINLFASLSPDRTHLASVSGDGLFVMDLDGSNVTQLIVDPGISGTVSWIP
jgi:Tol biopolymer transport system component